MALRQGRDAIGENGCIVEVVCHEEDRKFELVEKLLQLEPERRTRVRIERRQRLVEEEHTGLARERTRESDPLALAA